MVRWGPVCEEECRGWLYVIGDGDASSLEERRGGKGEREETAI